MPGQLSLFPAGEMPEIRKDAIEVDMNALDEMFEANPKFRQSHTYLEIMRFISNFPKYSAFNGLLLYLQNSHASYVATAGTWLKQFGRSLLPNARPLLILAPMSPVRFLYDLADTKGDPFPESRPVSFDIRDKLPQDVYDKTLHNCRLHGIAVHLDSDPSRVSGGVISVTYDTRKKFPDVNIDSRIKYLILLNKMDTLASKYAILIQELGHVFSGHVGIDERAWWQDRSGIDREQADLEAESIAFLVCCRRGLFSDSARYLRHLETEDKIIPPLGLNAVFHATHYIEQMGKAEWKQPKKKSRYQ